MNEKRTFSLGCRRDGRSSDSPQTFRLAPRGQRIKAERQPWPGPARHGRSLLQADAKTCRAQPVRQIRMPAAQAVCGNDQNNFR